MKPSRALLATGLLFVATNAFAQNGGREDGSPAPPPYQPAPAPYQPAPPPQPAYGQPGPYGYGQPYAQPQYAPGPTRMPYNEGDPVPPGYHVTSRRRTGLLVGGGIVFGLFYGFTVAGASSSANSDTNWLYLPVVGPVLYGNTLKSEFAGVSRFFLWIDALAQAAGAAMLVGGFIPKTELVRNDVATVNLQPIVTPGGGGAALTGLF